MAEIEKVHGSRRLWPYQIPSGVVVSPQFANEQLAGVQIKQPSMSFAAAGATPNSAETNPTARCVPYHGKWADAPLDKKCALTVKWKHALQRLAGRCGFRAPRP